MLKTVIIGCGSIGKRHLKNLLFLGEKDILAFDTDKSKLKKLKAEFPYITISTNIHTFWAEKPNVTFIATPPSSHISYALQAANHDCHLFIEKPVSNNLRGVNHLLHVVEKKKLVTMVACNLRFYWAIKKMKDCLQKNAIGKVYSAHIEMGWYLPNWRPSVDYRKSYSAQKRLGGGIILDAIHEFDYAAWFFGEVDKLTAFYGKFSDLAINTEDTAKILLTFKNGPLVSIHIDYLQQNYSRSCKIIGEYGTISWNLSDHSIEIVSTKDKTQRQIKEPVGYTINDMYVDQMNYFLNCVKKQKDTFNTIHDALTILKIALWAKRKQYAV